MEPGLAGSGGLLLYPHSDPSAPASPSSSTPTRTPSVAAAELRFLPLHVCFQHGKERGRTAAAERRGACGEREEPSPTPLSIRRRSSRRRSRVLLPLPSRNPSRHQVIAIVLLEEELIHRGSRYSTSPGESLAPWRPAPAGTRPDLSMPRLCSLSCLTSTEVAHDMDA